MWRLLAILRFAHDRLMLQIGPNPRSCGGKSLSRTHAAANREFDRRAALWLHIGGWRAALFPRISADYGEMHGRPLAPLWGWRAAFFSPISADYGDERRHMAALWLHYGAGGRLFVPDAWSLWRRPCCPPAPHHGDWRAAFCPGNAPIMATSMLPFSSPSRGLGGGFLSRYASIMATRRICHVALASSKQRTRKRNGRSHAAPRAANRRNADGSDPGSA